MTDQGFQAITCHSVISPAAAKNRVAHWLNPNDHMRIPKAVKAACHWPLRVCRLSLAGECAAGKKWKNPAGDEQGNHGHAEHACEEVMRDDDVLKAASKRRDRRR
jgi:hypothetical protein